MRRLSIQVSSENGRNARPGSPTVKDKKRACVQNIVGPVVRKLRYQKGWTQATLTARCVRIGWDVSENTVAKIEAQIRCVTDREILYLTRGVGVELKDVFPEEAKSQRINK